MLHRGEGGPRGGKTDGWVLAGCVGADLGLVVKQALLARLRRLPHAASAAPGEANDADGGGAGPGGEAGGCGGPGEELMRDLEAAAAVVCAKEPHAAFGRMRDRKGRVGRLQGKGA